MKQWKVLAISVLSAFLIPISFAEPSRVKVVNESDKSVYIHKGGYAPSYKLAPGESRTLDYPFSVIPPGADKAIKSSLLVGSAGGRWMTSPNGSTFLEKPTMLICLDYASQEHKDKSGERLWTIKKAEGFDEGCEVKSYNQPWFLAP